MQTFKACNKSDVENLSSSADRSAPACCICCICCSMARATSWTHDTVCTQYCWVVTGGHRISDIAEHQNHVDNGLTCPTMPDSWSAPVNTSSVMCESTLRSKSVGLHGHQESTRRHCLYLRLSRASSTTATTRRASTLFMMYSLRYQWPIELPSLLTTLRQSRHTTCAALLQRPGRQS